MYIYRHIHIQISYKKYSIIHDDARIWLDRVWPKLHRPRPKLPRSGFPSWMCAYTIG